MLTQLMSDLSCREILRQQCPLWVLVV